MCGDLIKGALRKGGITTLPGTTPSPDQSGELISELNRMMEGLSLDGHNIYTTSIDRYALTPNQTTYFIGPTGDFVAPRPIFISRANIIVTGSSPELHLKCRILTDEEWGAKTITELPAPWPWELYNDGGTPDSKLYLYGYPTEPNDLELYTWQELQDTFTSMADAAVFPIGYADAIIPNLALRVTELYPLDSHLTAMQMQRLEKSARVSLEALHALNTTAPDFRNETATRGNGDARSAFYKFGANL